MSTLSTQEIKIRIPGFEVTFTPTSSDTTVSYIPSIQTRVEEYLRENNIPYTIKSLVSKSRWHPLPFIRWKLWLHLKNLGYYTNDIANYFNVDRSTISNGIRNTKKN